MSYKKLFTIPLSIISIALLTACNGQSSSNFQTPTNQSLIEKNTQKSKNGPPDILCSAVYKPVCAKESVNNAIVFNTYSNSCILMSNATKGTVLSATDGVCKNP